MIVLVFLVTSIIPYGVRLGNVCQWPVNFSYFFIGLAQKLEKFKRIATNNLLSALTTRTLILLPESPTILMIS